MVESCALPNTLKFKINCILIILLLFQNVLCEHMFYDKERINIGVSCEFLQLQNKIKIFTEQHHYDDHQFNSTVSVLGWPIYPICAISNTSLYWGTYIIFYLLLCSSWYCILSMRPFSLYMLIQCYEVRLIVMVYSTQTDCIGFPNRK